MKTPNKYTSLFLCIALALNVAGQNKAISQENANPIRFKGRSNLYAQYSSRPGSYQQLPASSLVWDFNSTLFVFDIPVTTSFLLSTSKGAYGQDISRFRISLAGQSFKDKVPFLSHFSRLNFGTSTPRYSSLVLNGVAVYGIDIEFNPGLFYLAITSGKIKNVHTNFLNEAHVNPQKILAGKIGVGKKNSSHFFLTAMHAWDEQIPDPKEGVNNQCRDNYILGADARVSLIKNKFYVQGELMTTMYSRDVSSIALEQDDFAFIPSWLFNQLKPTISSTLDYAYSASTALNLSNTRFSAKIRKVGPSFQSLAVPYLRNDELNYQVNFRQNIWKRRITLGSYFRRGQDNLIPWKQSTSISSSYGFDITVKPGKQAYLKLNYAPYFVYNDSEIELYKVDTKTSLLSFAAGYNHNFGGLKSNTNLLMSYQNNKTNRAGGMYSVLNCSVSQSISLKNSLSFSGNAVYNRIQQDEALHDIYSIALRGSYNTKKRWRTTFGLRISFKDTNDSKTGFYLNSSYPVRKNLKVNFQVRQNFFSMQESMQGRTNETIFRLGLTLSW